MIADPVAARVVLSAGGREAALCFTWSVIAGLRERLGEEYLARVAAGIDQRDVAAMADLVAAASGKTAVEVMEWSPPIIPTVEALQRAWALAWIGPEAVQDVEEAASTDDEPDPPPARPILSVLRSVLRSASGSGGPSSGALHRMRSA